MTVLSFSPGDAVVCTATIDGCLTKDQHYEVAGTYGGRWVAVRDDRGVIGHYTWPHFRLKIAGEEPPLPRLPYEDGAEEYEELMRAQVAMELIQWDMEQKSKATASPDGESPG